ncbi:MAG: fibronectin type III-like domain-contianing protein [Candidatus Binataceae bacterium]
MANDGPSDGDEVVRLCLRDKAGSVTRPVRELKGFKRVPIRSGEKRRLTFLVDLSEAAFHGSDLRFAVEPGEMEVMIGASSSDIRFRADFRIIGQRCRLTMLEVVPAKVEVGSHGSMDARRKA